MIPRVRLTQNARRDRDRVLAWYDTEAPAQSERFLDEFYAAAWRLQSFPLSGIAMNGDARRVNLRIFPYQIWYRLLVEAEIIEIIAVVHHRQDSDQFSRRDHLS